MINLEDRAEKASKPLVEKEIGCDVCHITFKIGDIIIIEYLTCLPEMIDYELPKTIQICHKKCYEHLPITTLHTPGISYQKLTKEAQEKEKDMTGMSQAMGKVGTGGIERDREEGKYRTLSGILIEEEELFDDEYVLVDSDREKSIFRCDNCDFYTNERDEILYHIKEHYGVDKDSRSRSPDFHTHKEYADREESKTLDDLSHEAHEKLRQMQERIAKHPWKLDPPTDKQLNYLKSLGYTGPKPRTKGEASKLINKYKWDDDAEF